MILLMVGSSFLSRRSRPIVDFVASGVQGLPLVQNGSS